MSECKRCGLDKGNRHECPNIFIHKADDNEIIIRGNNLNIHWEGNKVIIKPKGGI